MSREYKIYEITKNKNRHFELFIQTIRGLYKIKTNLKKKVTKIKQECRLKHTPL